VTLSWNSPPAEQPQPYYYQVLCANFFRQPLAGKAEAAAYSQCGPGGTLRRRGAPNRDGAADSLERLDPA